MKIILFRKTLVFGLVFIFVGAGVLPSVYGSIGLLDDFDDESDYKKIR